MTKDDDTPNANAPLVGAARIAAYVRLLPDLPGVYRMLDAKGDVLYVGKAKSLKKRVAAYAKSGGQTERIARMISETRDMLFVTTASESEALLLESNLIKRLKPRYNVSFRDDKSFPNILLREDHPFPQLVKHRGARTTKGHYYGPFASAGAVNRTLNTLQRAFLLRSCSDSVFESRTRPCLLYQIKRCSGPCVGRIDSTGYHELVHEAEDFLSGKSRSIQAQLAKEMDAAAAALDFERAAILRDRIRAMSHIQSNQGINPTSFTDADVFALFSQGSDVCIQVFFFRAGQNWGNRPYFPRSGAHSSAAEILSSFIAQFYDERESPPLILVSDPPADAALLADALSSRTGKRVEIALPQRGEKRDIVEMARSNAREQLARRLAENSAQVQLLEGLADLFGMDSAPRRIEVYDNSHIQGRHAVGAMIVAGPDGFEKGEYRKFNIRSEDLTPGDDYAMLREVLSRRFGRLLKDEDTARAKWPDLVLIDGGEGQLSIACQVFADLGIEDVELVAISKGPDRDAGREHFYRPGQPPFRLDLKNPVLYYLQRLRDEAHRFAIGSHRKRRSKALGANPLDEVAGVGAARKRALLQHFGSARAVSAASLTDLQSVEGVSATLAKKIFDFFHAGG
ncbi:MAG: excinuclease ABC subunit UvrC [Alphaproteobacteria bacterium]|nr:excinuclease ABC subunit UvrC [Alphaproteobacteria bacterium]